MLRAGHGLMLLTTALLAVGVVMVNSAGVSVRAQPGVTLSDVLLGRYAILAGLAVALMLAGSRLSIERLQRAGGWLAPCGVIGMVVLLLAVHLPVIGREVNGARRWIDLGFVSFQPSEIAKWGMVLVLAWYATRHASEMGRLGRGLMVPKIPVTVVCVLIATEDLGTAVLIGLVSVTLLLAAGVRLWQAALLAGPAAAGLAAAVLSTPYRLDRLRAFLDPFQDPQGIGYHMIQSMVTVAGGGVAGRGLGNSVQKFGYLPEDTTDFIFAIICEELGLMGAAVIVFLYGGLVWCGWSIIRRQQDAFRKLLGLGFVLTIGLQALINMAVVTGLAPTKGIALPLVSAGGTGWVLTAFCLGLLVSMERAAVDGQGSTKGQTPRGPRWFRGRRGLDSIGVRG